MVIYSSFPCLADSKKLSAAILVVDTMHVYWSLAGALLLETHVHHDRQKLA